MGQNQLVPILLRHRADINSFDNEGWTGLHLASNAGHLRTVKCLIENHANVDAQTRYGRTALHWACSEGRKNNEQHLGQFTVVNIYLGN